VGFNPGFTFMVGDVNLGCFIRVLSTEASEELTGFRDRHAVFTAFLMLGTAFDKLLWQKMAFVVEVPLFTCE
jgi:hypothetical protein